MCTCRPVPVFLLGTENIMGVGIVVVVKCVVKLKIVTGISKHLPVFFGGWIVVVVCGKICGCGK